MAVAVSSPAQPSQGPQQTEYAINPCGWALQLPTPTPKHFTLINAWSNSSIPYTRRLGADGVTIRTTHNLTKAETRASPSEYADKYLLIGYIVPGLGHRYMKSANYVNKDIVVGVTPPSRESVLNWDHGNQLPFMAVVRITTEQRREAGGFKVFALIDPDKHGLCTPYRGMRNEVFFLSHFRDNLPGRTVEARSVHWGNRAMGVAFQLGKGAEILSEQGGISDRDGTSDDGGEIWGLEDGERDGTARNGNNDPFHRQTGFQPADNQHGAPTAHAGQIQEKDLAGSILHVAESFGDQLKDLVRNYKQTGDATKLKTLWYLVGNSNTGYCPLPTRLAQFLRIDIAFPADQYEALAVDIRAVWPDIVTANAYSLMLTRDVMVSTGLIVEYRLCRAFLAEALYRLSKVPTPFMTLSKAQVTALVFEAFHTVERIMPRKIQAPPRIQAPLSP